jgi:CheY-like chemotaxis protein
MSVSGPSSDGDDVVSPRQRVRVLIVEDHPDVGWLMQSLVTHCGYEARWAASSAEAMAAALDFQPQIAILDIGLPEVSGYELAAQLTANPLLPRPILIALTGHSDDDNRQRSQEAGFAHHLVKPVSLPILARILQECSQNV